MSFSQIIIRVDYLCRCTGVYDMSLLHTLLHPFPLESLNVGPLWLPSALIPNSRQLLKLVLKNLILICWDCR